MAALKDGEIWRLSILLNSNSRYDTVETYQFKRLEMTTGIERRRRNRTPGTVLHEGLAQQTNFT